MQHTATNNKKWQSLTLYEQMGNIGSEVGRSVSSRNRRSAIDRAFELFDLTLADTRWAGTRRREIARARENYAEIIASENLDELNKLSKYFYHFALASRKGK